MFGVEKMFMFVGIVVLCFGCCDGLSVDEVFVCELRVLLRRAFAGRRVSFRVEYAVELINCEFGVVFMESGENVSVM